MTLDTDISDSVDAALRHDGKIPDPDQVMQESPYSYTNTILMRDFLLDVNHELNKRDRNLDVDSLDLPTCMGDTVDQLCGDILNAMSS